MKIKPINTEKTQGNHPRRVLLTTLAGTHNIPCHPSLSIARVCKVPRQVRTSSFQFLSLFLRVISI
jgi:hypothetical protein